MTMTLRPAALVMASSVLALGLWGCKIDNRPLLARNGPPADAAYGGLPAPGPLDLAAAPPAPIAYAPPQQAYAYAQRAYGMEPVTYDAPPQYGFAYGDEQPWVWQTADDGWMYVEPIDDGYRYYYYEAGQDYPYFVRDPDYGYGYGPNGALVALYGVGGVLLSGDHYRGAADRAGRYWQRAYSLREASARAPRMTVSPQQWRARAPRFERAHTQWTQPAKMRGASGGGYAGGHGEQAFAPAAPGWRDHGGAQGRDAGAAMQGRHEAPGQMTAGRGAAEHGREAKNRGQPPAMAEQGHGGGRQHGAQVASAPQPHFGGPHGGGPEHGPGMAQAPQPQTGGGGGHGGGGNGGGHGRGQQTAEAAQPHGGGGGGGAQPHQGGGNPHGGASGGNPHGGGGAPSHPGGGNDHGGGGHDRK